MGKIFEPIALEIDDVKYEVESESSTDARESLMAKLKRIIKEDIESMLI